MGGLWLIIFHELGIDTCTADDIPNWIGKLPVWACILIPIALFGFALLIAQIPFIL